MVSRLTCEELRELAPELALGVLDGGQRAAALEHLGRCSACRAHLADLSRTADALLLTGPEAEPPEGFEDSVLRRLRPQPLRWVDRWRPVAAAAAIVAIAVGLGAYIGRMSAPSTPRELALRTAPVVSARSGDRVGEVYLHQDGNRSWCFVSIESPPHEGVYDVRAKLRDGRVVAVDQFAVHEGKGAYGQTLDVPADDIVSMTMVSTDGKWSFWADLST
jgi:hypothetical protein